MERSSNYFHYQTISVFNSYLHFIMTQKLPTYKLLQIQHPLYKNNAHTCPWQRVKYHVYGALIRNAICSGVGILHCVYCGRCLSLYRMRKILQIILPSYINYWNTGKDFIQGSTRVANSLEICFVNFVLLQFIYFKHRYEITTMSMQ